MAIPNKPVNAMSGYVKNTHVAHTAKAILTKAREIYLFKLMYTFQNEIGFGLVTMEMPCHGCASGKDTLNNIRVLGKVFYQGIGDKDTLG